MQVVEVSEEDSESDSEAEEDKVVELRRPGATQKEAKVSSVQEKLEKDGWISMGEGKWKKARKDMN